MPDILNYGGHNVVQEIIEVLDEMGYEAAYSLINAVHHGVPQMRDRVYMIAFHREVGAAIRFPAATQMRPASRIRSKSYHCIETYKLVLADRASWKQIKDMMDFLRP